MVYLWEVFFFKSPLRIARIIALVGTEVILKYFKMGTEPSPTQLHTAPYCGKYI